MLSSGSTAAVVVMKLHCEHWLSLRAWWGRRAANLLQRRKGRVLTVKYTSKYWGLPFWYKSSVFLVQLLKAEVIPLKLWLLCYNKYQHLNKQHILRRELIVWECTDESLWRKTCGLEGNTKMEDSYNWTGERFGSLMYGVLRCAACESQLMEVKTFWVL